MVAHPSQTTARAGLFRGLDIAIVDAGPLYAAADADDRDHAASFGALADPELELVIPALVVAEAT